VDGKNSGKPSGESHRDAHGNPEPSRRYTAGRCRDYLRARGVAGSGRKSEAPLMTGIEPPAPSRAPPAARAGEEIVHSRWKHRGAVNPLVVGSNPTGPIFKPTSAAPATPGQCHRLDRTPSVAHRTQRRSRPTYRPSALLKRAEDSDRRQDPGQGRARQDETAGAAGRFAHLDG
jgi:hypothetical protein